MFSKNLFKWQRQTTTLLLVAGVVAGVSLGGRTAAAAPITVGYSGTRVTTATPGKPFTLKFQVKNAGSEAFSGVKVTFHIPEGLKHSQVSPADAMVDENTIMWENLYMDAGQSFYPTFTFTLDSGTSLNSKRNIWVEAQGTDMEATSVNFSITAKAAAVRRATSTLTSADVKSMFQSVYDRTPTASELRYWLGRRTDKPQRSALLGAMAYHKAQNIRH